MKNLTQSQRILMLLTQAGSRGLTTADFLEEHLPRFSARIMELRKAGHRITSERVREGSWRYVLESSFGGPQPDNGAAMAPAGREGPAPIHSRKQGPPPEEAFALKLFESAA